MASTQDPSAAVVAYEDRKRSHNNTAADCETAGITFVPMVVDGVGGGWGPSAASTFSELAKNKASVSGELRN
eukprot:10628109-Karenia_brevis.AAC.1